MKIGFKYKYCNGFGKMYNYGLKHFNPNIMITNQAKERLRILNYWKNTVYQLLRTLSELNAQLYTIGRNYTKNQGIKLKV